MDDFKTVIRNDGGDERREILAGLVVGHGQGAFVGVEEVLSIGGLGRGATASRRHGGYWLALECFLDGFDAALALAGGPDELKGKRSPGIRPDVGDDLLDGYFTPVLS